MSDDRSTQKEKLRLLLEAKAAGARQKLDDEDIRVCPTCQRTSADSPWDYVGMDADNTDVSTFCNSDPTDPVHYLWPNPYLLIRGTRDDAE
jgi:hypothetical protein